MAGGRPRTSLGREELRGLAEYLEQARTSSRLTIADVLRRTGIASKAGYEFFRAQRLPTQTEVAQLAKVLGDEVLEPWRTAKAAVERAELAHRSAGVVKTWDELPTPDPALAEILQAQLAVTDRFPYTLLGIDGPKVSSLYVPEQLRWENPKQVGAQITTVSSALAKHRNIIITGEPGGGKSMAARRVVHRVAARWLRHDGVDVPLAEPVAAIYLPAADLTPAKPWTESIAEALARSGRFWTRPVAAQFAERAQGTRWLIVIDGLDEIADRGTRREILELLGDLMRGGGPYRFILLSRPLPEDELQRLGHAVPRFKLQRFDSQRLAQFSRRWFASKDAPEGASHRFVDALTDAGLREVVAVPLFATIAAAVAGLGSPDEVPRSRLELYERFVDELLEARALADSLSPYRSWLRTQRASLLEYLAESHVDSGVVHLAAAEGWLERRRPEVVTSPRTAADEIRHSLIETGVVTLDGTEVRFPHQSLAEYLAARARAARIPAHFPGLATAFDTNQYGSKWNLMVLTIAAWTRSPRNDPALVFRYLLNQGHLSMAIDLITTGVTPGPAIENAVATRALIACRDDLYLHPTSASHELLVRLGPRHISRDHFVKFLMSRTRRPEHLAEIAATYGNMFDRDAACRILTDLSRSDDSTLLCEVAKSFDSMGMTSTSTEVWRRVAEDDSTAPTDRAIAAYHLATRGQPNASDAAWKAFDEADSSTNARAIASEALVAEHGRAVVTKICDRLNRKKICTWNWSQIALLFAERGATDDAIGLAAAVLETSCDSDDDIHKAIEALAVALRSEEPREATSVVLQKASHVPEYLAIAATQLSIQGAGHAAVAIARECVSMEAIAPWAAIRAIETILTAGDSLAPSDVAALLLHPALDAEQRLRLASNNALLVSVETIRSICESVLSDPASTTRDLTTAASTWLHKTEGKEATVVARLLADRSLPPDQLVNVLRSFAHTGTFRDVVVLLEPLLRDPTAGATSLADAVRLCAEHLSSGELERLLQLFSNRLLGNERILIAEVLRAARRADLGVPLWRAALVDSSTAIADRIEAADRLLTFSSADDTAAILLEAGRRGVDEVEANTLRKLIGWVKASAPVIQEPSQVAFATTERP
ncbi:NACHT domain-containing protein [Amycolatopsis japonica]